MFFSRKKVEQSVPVEVVTRVMDTERAVEVLGQDEDVLTAVRSYSRLQAEIGRGGMADTDRLLLAAAEETLWAVLQQKGIELESVRSSAGFDNTLPTFARQYEESIDR